MTIESSVYDILIKKRYNRDEPYLKDDIKEKLHYFISHNKPIKFIGFWGIGPKSKPNWADKASCEFIVELNEAIRKVYLPAIEFTFIFATMHAIHNGISRKIINSYIAKMEKIFKKFNFKFMYLDMLWEKWGINFKKIDEFFTQCIVPN